MKNYSTSVLTSDLLHTSASRISEIIKNSLLSDPFVAKVFPFLTKWTTELSNSLGRTTNPEQVQMLKKKDGKRDGLYVGLRDFVKSASNDLDADIASAGKNLVLIFRELGWTMYTLGYAAESSKLKALIEKLEKEPSKSALASIGADVKFTNLKAAQDDFENTFTNKVDVNVAKEYLRVHECRKNIYWYIDALLGYIDLMDELEGGDYHKAAVKINEVVAETLAIARAGQTRKENKDKGDKADPGK